MKQFLSFIQAWLSTITFKKALSFSVLVHIAVVGCISFAISLFNVSNIYEPPLVFDFVFAPAEDHRNSELDAFEFEKKLKQKESGPAEQTTPLEQQSNKEKPAPVKTDKLGEPEAKQTEQSDAVTESEQPTYFPESPLPLQDKNLFALNELDPASFALPTTVMDISKNISAKISMSKKQLKMLNKKFRKWSENFHKMEMPDSSLFWEKDDQHYKAVFKHKPAQNNTEMDEVFIKIETTKDGVKLASEMKMKRLAFSNFAQFVDYWDPRVAVHHDELKGRFHSNSQININKSRGAKPKFHGKVTTSSLDVINTASRMPVFDESSIFLGGLETGVKPIKLPKKLFPFISDSDTSLSQVYKINQDAKIVFHSDGSFTVKKFKSKQTRKILMNQDVCYIFGGKKSDLHIEGAVKGKVLIYARDDIIIEGDLTYVNHPLTSNVVDDYLGLLSEKNVKIAHPDITGRGDLNIYASIYAKGRFEVSRYLKDGDDATLYIYGSLAAGTISATEPRYATHVTFDKRLERYRPPSFPMTNRYEVSEFEPQWQIKSEDKL